jgi:predicted O-linked N-acetylglucosamine transferase (SPINDLY family)
LVLLPNLGCRYPSLAVPEVPLDGVELSAIGQRPMLLCAGTPYKYLPATDVCLAAIARAVPHSVLVFFTDGHAGTTARLVERMRLAFARADIEFDRHAVVLPRLDRPRFFALMRRAHLFLDTIGFSGFNTAMQAIECGLPVVAYEGQFLRGRLASGIVRRLGMHELVARSAGEYVERVVEAAAPAANQQARRSIAARRSVLFDDQEPVRALNALLRDAVRVARR